MSRYFNNKEIELLAPVGTFKDFKEIIKSKADAVYFGGKDFNMRLHKDNYNLTAEEIKKAISMAHSLSKKVYITFNNMMSDSELNASKEFLYFLQEAGPDALIIQDLGAVKMIKDMKINIPLHASVMMNVHNKCMIDKLLKLGISRVVTSREMNLQEIHRLSENTSMEFEYFIHGDMCVVHGSHCLYGGILFGKSSNRGLCLKPCRWPFKLKQGDFVSYEAKHLLAVKDMCMYTHLPDLIEAGVCSFKIEGRMRDSNYLTELVNIYGSALDRYIENPAGYYIEKDFKALKEKRVRNFSTAYAFKIPGSSNIDAGGEREPKIFSKAVEEFEISVARTDIIKNNLKGINNTSKPLLAVKVNNLSSLKIAVDNGADEIYIAGDIFNPDKPFSLEELREASLYAHGKKLYMGMPKMMFERQFTDYSASIKLWESLNISGLLVTNLGAAEEYKNIGFDLIGDYSLNCYNEETVKFYKKEGLSRICLSLEAPCSILSRLLSAHGSNIEIIVQGSPTVMYMEHCVYAARNNETAQNCFEVSCDKGPISLIDERGFPHQVFADQYCRNHIITSKDICLIPILKEMCLLGTAALRIEGQNYPPKILGKIISIYREAIDNISICEMKDYVSKLKELTGRGQSFGALNFD